MSKATLLTISLVFGFISVMFLAHHWSGWNLLARCYRFGERVQGKRRWTFLTARMGVREPGTLLDVQMPLLSLRNCLNLVANERGVGLSLFPMCRLCHPPLFIPWEHISTEACSGVLHEWTELRFREAPSVVLRVSKAVGQELARYQAAIR